MDRSGWSGWSGRCQLYGWEVDGVSGRGGQRFDYVAGDGRVSSPRGGQRVTFIV